MNYIGITSVYRANVEHFNLLQLSKVSWYSLKSVNSLFSILQNIKNFLWYYVEIEHFNFQCYLKLLLTGMHIELVESLNGVHYQNRKQKYLSIQTPTIIIGTHFCLSCRDPNAVQSRQRIVDILLQIMVGSMGFSVSIRSQKPTVSCNVVASIDRNVFFHIQKVRHYSFVLFGMELD